MSIASHLRMFVAQLRADALRTSGTHTLMSLATFFGELLPIENRPCTARREQIHRRQHQGPHESVACPIHEGSTLCLWNSLFFQLAPWESQRNLRANPRFSKLGRDGRASHGTASSGALTGQPELSLLLPPTSIVGVLPMLMRIEAIVSENCFAMLGDCKLIGVHGFRAAFSAVSHPLGVATPPPGRTGPDGVLAWSPSPSTPPCAKSTRSADDAASSPQSAVPIAIELWNPSGTNSISISASPPPGIMFTKKLGKN